MIDPSVKRLDYAIFAIAGAVAFGPIAKTISDEVMLAIAFPQDYYPLNMEVRWSAVLAMRTYKPLAFFARVRSFLTVELVGALLGVWIGLRSGFCSGKEAKP